MTETAPPKSTAEIGVRDPVTMIWSSGTALELANDGTTKTLAAKAARRAVAYFMISPSRLPRRDRK
jgi:hypothetical protein